MIALRAAGFLTRIECLEGTQMTVETQCEIALTRPQLTHTLVALRAYAKSLINRAGEDLGGDYEDLLVVEGIIRQLEEVRDKKGDAAWIAAEE